MVPIEAQISAVRRELALWRAVYPRSVATGKMKQAAADAEIAAMEAVLESLDRLRVAQKSPILAQANANQLK